MYAGRMGTYELEVEFGGLGSLYCNEAFRHSS